MMNFTINGKTTEGSVWEISSFNPVNGEAVFAPETASAELLTSDMGSILYCGNQQPRDSLAMDDLQKPSRPGGLRPYLKKANVTGPADIVDQISRDRE